MQVSWTEAASVPDLYRTEHNGDLVQDLGTMIIHINPTLHYKKGCQAHLLVALTKQVLVSLSFPCSKGILWLIAKQSLT